jgi:hypothetical protein
VTTLVAAGVRTAARPGWRSSLATAISVALGRPSLWVLGGLGFAARGGLIVLALPIVTIPSPIVLSTIFRDEISTTGLAPSAIGLVLALLGVLIVAILGGLVAAAYADVAAFERLVGDPDTDDLRAGIPARPVRHRRRLVLALATAQLVALIPAVVAVALVAQQLNLSFIAELTHPTSTLPLFLRVVMDAEGPFLALGVALLVADLLYALASRAVLARAVDVGPAGRSGGSARLATRGALRILTRPLRTVVTAVLAWFVTFAILTPVAWATVVAWGTVRTTLLSGGGFSDPGSLAGALIATALLAAIWVAGIILAGFASACRAALWSVDALR